MAKRTYIQVEDRNPFGDEFDESILEDPTKDSTYIEGYSDVRRQRELAVRNGERPAPLKHRLQWARGKTFDGSRNDGRRIMHWQTNKRYEMLRYDDAVKMGYRVDLNPAIVRGDDGNAYLGERVLMYAGAKVAAANLEKVRKDTAELAERPKRDMEAAVERFNVRTKGAHATAFSFLGDDDPDEIAKRK